jgi:16S rRNA G527 N7-methylase RsmG
VLRKLDINEKEKEEMIKLFSLLVEKNNKYNLNIDSTTFRRIESILTNLGVEL